MDQLVGFEKINELRDIGQEFTRNTDQDQNQKTPENTLKVITEKVIQNGKEFLSLDQISILLWIQELTDLLWFLDFYLDHPAFFV